MRLNRRVLVSVIAAGAWVVPQQPGRDAGLPAAGSGIIGGRVVTAGDPAEPVRRALVRAVAEGAEAAWTATADDEGRFTIAGLPAGRYVLTAEKAAWLPASYGAAAPWRPGVPIPLADGARLDDVVLRMARGAVISGIVRDRTGGPMVGAQVSVLRRGYSPLDGSPTLVAPASGGRQTADDRGLYRAFGLPPGEYVIMASVRQSGPPGRSSDIRQLTDGDVDRVIGEARSGGARAPAAVGVRGGGAPPALDPGLLVGFAPVFFPGSVDPEGATSVRVAPGEQRLDIDLVLPLVPVSRVTGTLTLPPDLTPQSVSLSLVPARPSIGPASILAARADAAGGFAFSGVTPGEYLLVARGRTPDAAAPSGGLEFYGTADVRVEGRDVRTTLALSPGAVVAGRVVFDGASPSAEDVAGIRIALSAAAGAPALTVSPARVDRSGAFRLTGVPPGRYRVAATLPPRLAAWVLRTASAGAADAVAPPIDVGTAAEVSDLVLTFTDRPTELTGTLAGPAGRAPADCLVIVFPATRDLWADGPRRIRQVRPALDGAFTVRGLPPGRYFVGAVTDAEPGEWFDPAFLEALAAASVPVTLEEGRSTVQHLRVGGLR